MRTSRISAALVSLSIFLTGPAAVRGQPKPAQAPPKDWKGDQVFRLSVETWDAARSDTRAAKPTAAYHVDVRHYTVAPAADMPYWILIFEPSPGTPRRLRGSYSTWVYKDGHLVAKAEREFPRQEREEREVISFIDNSAVARPFEGMPMELVAPTLPRKFANDKGTMELLREDDGDNILMVAVIKIKGHDQVQITQTWRKGEIWWREYTREVNGRKVLQAKFTSIIPLTQFNKEKALRENHNAHTTWDDRLTVKVNVVKQDAKVSEMIDPVLKASGVTLTVDESLRGYVPSFGYCQFKDCPAWVVVNFVASHYHEAKWEVRKGGYVLKPAMTMTDAGLKNIADADEITSLNLFSTQVTNEGLKELVRFPELATLDLANTRITDAGLKELASLKNLESLDLECTQVTEAGLKHLVGLKKLKSLNLRHTKVSRAGLVELQNAMPRWDIVR